MSGTSYLRPDDKSLVAIDTYVNEAGKNEHHAFVSASGHGLTRDEALDELVMRLRQLADLIEHRCRPDKASVSKMPPEDHE